MITELKVLLTLCLMLILTVVIAITFESIHPKISKNAIFTIVALIILDATYILWRAG